MATITQSGDGFHTQSANVYDLQELSAPVSDQLIQLMKN